ncbi:hypothetical protein TIFTF001_052743 [Ficus carica]|uniref:Uncharacterized protein n=1 Tax=Ficus carica TaxID=3494 RepID=A0AA88JCP4_FICCA|nr:hypothetical protein TIFTF001_052743 [Ficus carica]
MRRGHGRAPGQSWGHAPRRVEVAHHDEGDVAHQDEVEVAYSGEVEMSHNKVEVMYQDLEIEITYEGQVKIL